MNSALLSAPIKTLHDERLLCTEFGNLGVRDRETECVQESRAEPLVLDRIREIAAEVSDDAERQFEDVRGGCRVTRPIPGAPHHEESGLLLCTGN